MVTDFSASYVATATLSNGVTISNITSGATWNTDDAGVAAINSDGVLTGQGLGTATITATYRGRSATLTVRVSAKPTAVAPDPPQPSKPFPARANLAISFTPDPVPGSQVQCPGSRFLPPTWTFTEVFTETQGVGFNVKTATLNLYNEEGKLIYFENEPEEFYFPPYSVFMEEGCWTLNGSPSGFYSDSLDGVDDNGNHLTFASSRLRLLPVAGVSLASSRISLAPEATRSLVRRALRRIR